MTSSLSPVHHQCVHVHATLKPADDVFRGGLVGCFFWGSAARCLGGWAATLAGGHGSPAPTSHYSQRRRRVTSQTPADLLLARTQGGGGQRSRCHGRKMARQRCQAGLRSIAERRHLEGKDHLQSRRPVRNKVHLITVAQITLIARLEQMSVL